MRVCPLSQRSSIGTDFFPWKPSPLHFSPGSLFQMLLSADVSRRFYDDNATTTKNKKHDETSSWGRPHSQITEMCGGRFLKRALVPADIWTGRWLMCCFTLFSVDRVGPRCGRSQAGPPLCWLTLGARGKAGQVERDPPYLTEDLQTRKKPGGSSHWDSLRFFFMRLFPFLAFKCFPFGSLRRKKIFSFPDIKTGSWISRAWSVG